MLLLKSKTWTMTLDQVMCFVIFSIAVLLNILENLSNPVVSKSTVSGDLPCCMLFPQPKSNEPSKK